MTLSRVLESEVMDSQAEAIDYDAMDHREVNRRFVDDLLLAASDAVHGGEILDLGTGTAQIPIELASREPAVHVLAVDLARHMLELAARNVAAAGLQTAIRLQCIDAKRLDFADGRFALVMSNSIVHHIPEPLAVLREAVRVTAPAGRLFFRDLMRPGSLAELNRLVETYAAGANEHQRRMFAESLHAALTLDEVRGLVASLGFAADTVQATSDRHWTWSAIVG